MTHHPKGLPSARLEEETIATNTMECEKKKHISVIEEIKYTKPLEALIKEQQLSYFAHIMQRERSWEKSITVGMGGNTRTHRLAGYMTSAKH